MPSRNGAHAGAGIGSVNRSIGPAIECHGRRACCDHGDNDPEEPRPGRNSPDGEHCAAQRERERKDGVLPLDHLKGHAQVAEGGHGSIVAGSRVFGLGCSVLGQVGRISGFRSQALDLGL